MNEDNRCKEMLYFLLKTKHNGCAVIKMEDFDEIPNGTLLRIGYKFNGDSLTIKCAEGLEENENF